MRSNSSFAQQFSFQEETQITEQTTSLEISVVFGSRQRKHLFLFVCTPAFCPVS
jgi:hypothetical protein